MDDKVYRLLDAAANRACEATRVVEDIARFVLDDGVITAAWKQFRHDLATALQVLPAEARSAFREVASDVGTTLSLPTETQRATISDMAAANAARLQQSLRSLEEGAKLVDEELALKIESLRYRSYAIASSMTILENSLSRLSDVYLYVLVDGGESREDFVRLIDLLLAAKVDAIQLRDKSLEDAELLLRARLLTEKSRQCNVLTIINDRPDIAVLSQANGVHVGQEDLSVGEARQIVGAQRLIGVSTHGVDQLQQAVLDGANYAGIGPVFPSQTKSFHQHGGLALLQKVVAETAIPLFAIGGISLANVSDVVRLGIPRLAVASAITRSPDPEKAIKGFRAALADDDQRNVSRQSIPVT